MCRDTGMRTCFLCFDWLKYTIPIFYLFMQALATPTPFEYPKHRSSGISLDRLHMLLAVLSKHAKIRPHRSDIFLNAVGGLKLVDPSSKIGNIHLQNCGGNKSLCVSLQLT